MNNKYLGIHREGWKFFFIFILISFFGFFITKIIFYIFIFISLFTLWFFRDPERYFDSKDNQLLSAADGKICFIGEENPPVETQFKEKMKKISIFMNVFNVHVNRSPVDGIIEKIIYKNGKFFNASLDKASEYNERNSFIIETNTDKIVVVQIAGLIARRILSFISEGDKIDKGDRIGLIRFGSRVDIYFPSTYEIKVNQNDIVVAGETIIAER
jgi:phosphatidylserine decarboxylase|tara:strand:- start:684 stop:1325 length:642 start_codon:yes stop_codon:yes gene_type:complete